jgi:hypothetical protein
MVWSPDPSVAQPSSNVKAGLALGLGSDVVTYRYDRPGTRAGHFRLPADSYTIKQRIGATVQDLTDRALKVTAFNVCTLRPSLRAAGMPKLCADGSQDCWPTLAMTDAIVTITGEAASDSRSTAQ